MSSIEYKKDAASGGTSGDTNNNTNDDPFSGDYTGVGGNDGTNGDSNSASTTDETALLTLSKDERMNVTLTVDETDILSLEVGQEAQITINSIGEVFAGEVTEINRWATGSNGVTNYTAVISVPKDPRMLPGMSVRAVVRIQGVAGAILIPEQALHQTRDAAFVYTSVDPETGELGDPVSVVSGLSDGSMVEIVEGLAEGDTVYYTVVVDPWAYYYGTAGNASDGDAWVDVTASDGDVLASDGDAAGVEGDGVASDGNA